MRWPPLTVWIVAAVLGFAPALVAGGVEVLVDASRPQQAMEGFGATTGSLVYEGPLGDTLTPELRAQAIKALYGEVRINGGNLDVHFLKEIAPQPASSPHHPELATLAAHPETSTRPALLWNGYKTFGSEAMKSKVVDPGREYGFTEFCLHPKINTRFGSPYLQQLQKLDRERYLSAAAEQVVLCARFWRDQYKITPRFIMPFNEPTSGNRELSNGGIRDVVDLTKAIGKGLRAEGFKDVLLVVPCEETVAQSLRVSQAILEDEEARPFVGAIGYHCYPYGSPYASVKKILQGPGKGRPDPKEIEVRKKLSDLAAKHKLPLWMTEVSHSEVPALSFDALRGRAIHIHDELKYASASAFYGMNSLWDLTSHRDHFKGRGGDAKDALLSEQDTLVLIDNDKSEVYITGMGRAIGHYARWVPRGAVRLEAESTDPLVLVSAFHDPKAKRLVLVLINNSSDAQDVSVAAKGLDLAGKGSGEQSTEGSIWKELTPPEPSGGKLVLRLPAASVTSLALPLTAVAPT